MTGSDRELDAREVAGPPFDAISTALDGLEDGERLLLINSFEPEPLYEALETRGFQYEAKQVTDGERHVSIEAQ